MNEKYTNILQRLYKTNRFKKKKVDLQSIQHACEIFNNPQKEVNYIHVTGTNGKGSVCKKLSSVLIKSGFKTGLFTSPHISTFRERIQINDNYIEKDYIVEEMERIFKISEKNNLDLTYFEFVTLLSFNYFRDKKIDIGVMEVGLGGNLDATNVIDPLLSVITSIGMDHMDSLGYTLQEIAEKKAGIIKADRPVLIGRDCFPREVFINRANEVGSKLYFINGPENRDYNTSKCINFNNMQQVPKDFEEENKLIVTNAVKILKDTYPETFSHRITSEALHYGLSQKQPCRKEDVFEILGKAKISNNLGVDLTRVSKIFLDVGHNAHALDKLLYTLRSEYPKNKLKLICGFSAGKNKHDLFNVIFSYADEINLVAAKHARASKYEELIKEMKDWLSNYSFDREMIKDDLNYNLNEIYYHDEISDKIRLRTRKLKGDVEKTILDVLSNENNNSTSETKYKDIIVICGSFFLMKEARTTLGYVDEEDPFELNEINPLKFNV